MRTAKRAAEIDAYAFVVGFGIHLVDTRRRTRNTNVVHKDVEATEIG